MGRPPKSAAKSAEKPLSIFVDWKPCKANRLETLYSPTTGFPMVVLDTNVVLDATLFRDRTCTLLNEHLDTGQLRWIASSAMRAELAHVLSRPVFDARRQFESLVWARWDSRCQPSEPRALAGAALRMRCTDPDDQIFIDLALSSGARWLLSRDRAVLKLARRSRALGLSILTPAAWAAQASELHPEKGGPQAAFR